jgi:hypothetical protein
MFLASEFNEFLVNANSTHADGHGILDALDANSTAQLPNKEVKV